MFLLPDVPIQDREDGDSLCSKLERSSSVRRRTETRGNGMYRGINARSFAITSHEANSSTSMGSLSRFQYDTEDIWPVANYHTLERSYKTQCNSPYVDDDTGVISAHSPLCNAMKSMNPDNAHCSKKAIGSHTVTMKCLHFGSKKVNSIEQRINRAYSTVAPPSMPPQIDDRESTKCSKKKRLTLNIGGVVFETLEATLAVHPNTLLGDPDRRIKYLNRHTGELTFHRRFACFDAILFYYQSNGILARPQTVDQVTFESELLFFEIPLVNSRCLPHSHSKRPPRPKRDWQHGETMVRKLHRLFHRPFSSPLASTIAIFNILVTVLLICEFCLATFWKNRQLGPVDPISLVQMGENFKLLAATEIFCMLFCNIDFLIRLLLSQQRLKFLASYHSIIDVITMVSFHTSVLLSNLSIGSSHQSYLQLLRQVRILQIFRLARYNYGLRSLLQTICTSLVHLGSFILIIPIMSTFFASILFFLEEENHIQAINHRNHARPFGSLSDWFWYSIITITTVGYGDVYPRTVSGKVTGTICALFGVILFCLLTPIIFRQFVEQYYIPRLTSRNANDQERKLAENMRDMYYEDRID